jgi:hypothetical protein
MNSGFPWALPIDRIGFRYTNDTGMCEIMKVMKPHYPEAIVSTDSDATVVYLQESDIYDLGNLTGM